MSSDFNEYEGIQMSLSSFICHVYSMRNVIFDPSMQNVYMNMDLPLNNYYINSAKNPFEFELKHLDIPDAI